MAVTKNGKQMNRFSSWLVLWLVVAFAVSGCGFKVRGAGRQSGSELVGAVYIAERNPISVAVALRNALTAQQVRFVSKPEQANTIVVLDNEKLSRRVASVSASGRVSEYELLHAVDLLVLRSPKGLDEKKESIEALLSSLNPRTVSVIRDYTYDETDVLAKNDEERILRGEMEEELVRHLVLRILAGVL